MQNENLENKAGQVRRNPSRDNKNINQGQNYKKRIDSESLTGNQNTVDDDGISDTTDVNADYGLVGKTQQNSAGENSGDEQTGSQGLQNKKSSGHVKNDDAQKAGGGGSYEANEQFDDDQDYGSHQDSKSNYLE